MLHVFRDSRCAESLYSPAGLVEVAAANCGISAHSGDIDFAALETICAAFEAARPAQTTFGKIHAQRILLDALGKRLRLSEHLARYPEIRSVSLPSPVFIVAPFRTGSTFLHRLLAQDADNRWPRVWEVAYPPPPEPHLRGDARYFAEDPRIGLAEAALKSLRRSCPDLARLHPMHPHAAEECFGLLETSLLSHSFMFYAELPSYLDWLDSLSATAWRSAYAVYALQLRQLQWWFPGRRWVLKNPVHLWNLDVLLEAFPDAHIVQMHREPAAVMASFCGLLAAYRTSMCKAVDREAIGEQALSYACKALKRAVSARMKLDPVRFIDVRFEHLVRDPLAAATAIYARLGERPAPEAIAAMQAWLAQEGREPRASHLQLESFGLDREQVRRAFADYSAFGPPVRPPTL